MRSLTSSVRAGRLHAWSWGQGERDVRIMAFYFRRSGTCKPSHRFLESGGLVARGREEWR
jgi:hypothetical protein